jgi:DNA replication and repair protein RecF
VFLASLRLVNFRSYCAASVDFGPGLNVVVGDNATGKTNLLEGAWFALRGGSPRTRLDDKLVTWGEAFTRASAVLGGQPSGTSVVEVGYAPGEGKRVRWDGVEVASLDELRQRSQVFIFVPESLLLVKGSPARRRAHLDAFAAGLDPQYAAASRELHTALRQRNAELGAVRNGAPERALDAWDVQFATAAVELGRRRRAVVAELNGPFAAAATRLAPAGGSFALRLVTQVPGSGSDVPAFIRELRRRRHAEVRRGLSLFGPHRDDLRILEVVGGGQDVTCGATDVSGGRDLRLFGSQGEQRVAVLALLLAEREVAAARTGEVGTLFLDDVMSELDDARRRLLVGLLASGGQAVVTTTNRHYFTDDELARATVVELPLGGSRVGGAAQEETAARVETGIQEETAVQGAREDEAP